MSAGELHLEVSEDSAESLRLLADAYGVTISDVVDHAVGHLLDEAIVIYQVCKAFERLRAMLKLPYVTPPSWARTHYGNAYNMAFTPVETR
jgi:hypothetical protein